MEDVSRKYGPKRLHRRTQRLSVASEELRVHSTLLEYGKYSRGRAGAAGSEGSEEGGSGGQGDEEEALRRNLDEASEANRVSADNVGRFVNMGSENIRKVRGSSCVVVRPMM